MVKENKPKANLETIANEGKYFLINEMSDKEADITKKIPFWTENYIAKAYGEDQAIATYETLRRDTTAITPLIQEAKTKHEKGLIEEVKKDIKTVAREIGEQYSIGIASYFFGDEKYRELRDTIRNDGDVKTAYANAFDNDLWRKLVTFTTPEAVRGAANGYIERVTQREIAEHLCNEEGKFNPNKSAGYIAENISKQTGEKKETFYKDLGLAYAQTKMLKDQAQVEKTKEQK